MGIQNVNGGTQNNANVGQYDELMKKLNSQGATQVAPGTKETKAAAPGLGMNGPAVVITDAPQDPAAPANADQKQSTTFTELAQAMHSFREADAKLGTAIQQFMAKYNLTEQDCINFLEKALNEGKGNATDNSATQAATTKMLASTGSSAMGKIMFDLYSLLALMQETAQKERNAARLIRSEQSLQIQQAITEQADMQRYAAKLGLFFGLASAVISGIQALHGFIQTGRGMTQETNLRNEYGVNQAGKDFTAASTAAKPALEAKNALSQAQVNMEKTLPEPQSTQVKTDCAGGAKTKAEILGEIDQNAELTPAQKDLAKAYTEAFFTNKEVLDNGGAVALQNYTSAKTELTARTESMKMDAGYAKANQLQDIQGIRALRYGALTKLVESVGQGWAGIKNAEATEKGADIKRAEEEMEQIKDLFKQHEDIIQTVLSTLKAIQQAESQTIQGMFRA